MTYAEEIEHRVINPANAGRVKHKGVLVYAPVWKEDRDTGYCMLVGCRVVLRRFHNASREHWHNGTPYLLEVYYDGTGIFRPNCLGAIGQYNPRYAVKDTINKYYAEVERRTERYGTDVKYYDQDIRVLRRKPVEHEYTHLFSIGDSFDNFLTNKFNVGADV